VEVTCALGMGGGVMTNEVEMPLRCTHRDQITS